MFTVSCMFVTPTCVAGFFYDGVVCQPCDASCFECTGPSSDDCTVPKCPDGLYNDVLVGDCQFCHNSCPAGPMDTAGPGCATTSALTNDHSLA